MIMEKLDLMDLINELQEEIEMSPNKLMSKSKSIDSKIVLEIIADIRRAVEEEFGASRKVMKERDQILASANAQAEEILAVSREQAKEMIAEQAFSKMAYDKALKLLENAKAKSTAIRKNANDYAEEVLGEIETYFQEYVEITRENRQRLQMKMNAANDAAPQIEED